MSQIPIKISQYITNLIQKAQDLCELESARYVMTAVQDKPAFNEIVAGCRNLAATFQPSMNHWVQMLSISQQASRMYRIETIEELLGVLRSLQFAIVSDVVQSVADLVRAETFTDLLDQADYLFSERYVLASGVLGRAVLEDHLRNWCAKVGVTFVKARPTIEDFRQELYKTKHLDKAQFILVQSMAVTGNDCAHNKTFKDHDVERLLRDLRSFIANAGK